MKTLNLTKALVLAFVSSTVAANDSEPTEQHIQKAEFTALLKQYEKVRSMQLDAQLERALLEAEPNPPTDKLSVIEKRLDILTRQLSETHAATKAVHDSAKSKVAAASAAAAAIRQAGGIIDPDPEGMNTNLLLDKRQRTDVEAMTQQSRYVEAKAEYIQIKARYQALFPPTSAQP